MQLKQAEEQLKTTEDSPLRVNWFKNPVWRKKKSRTARAAFGARGFVLLISVQGHFQPHTGNNWILRQDSTIGLKWEKGRGKG